MGFFMSDPPAWNILETTFSQPLTIDFYNGFSTRHAMLVVEEFGYTRNPFANPGNCLCEKRTRGQTVGKRNRTARIRVRRL